MVLFTVDVTIAPDFGLSNGMLTLTLFWLVYLLLFTCVGFGLLLCFFLGCMFWNLIACWVVLRVFEFCDVLWVCELLWAALLLLFVFVRFLLFTLCFVSFTVCYLCCFCVFVVMFDWLIYCGLMVFV